MNNYYVYRHLNPITKQVFYVGIGKGDRVIDGGSKRNKAWKKYVYQNNGYVFDFVIKNISKSEALQIERKLIIEFGIDNLTNIVGESGNSSAFKKGQKPWNKGLLGAQACRYTPVEINGIKYDSVREARESLNHSQTHFYRLIKQGKIVVTYLSNDN